MGYFSNATEAEIYEKKYCSKCVNYKKRSCPILDAHMLYQKNHILDFFIPISSSGNNQKCKMFIDKNKKILSGNNLSKFWEE